MADDNKPMKYIRYAIGEILLVVIGILIALSINNWNENRKEKAMILEIIKEIDEDLNADIIGFSSGIKKYNESIERKKWGLQRTDYSLDQMDSIKMYLIPSSHDYKIVTKGFERLQNSGIHNYYKYNMIVKRLNDYYTVQLNQYDRTVDWDIKANENFWALDSDLKYETELGNFPTVLAESENLPLLLELIKTAPFRNSMRTKYHRRNYLRNEFDKMRSEAVTLREMIENNID